MARIFISYAHEDQAAARRLVDALAREGLEAWWDHAIPPGRSWDEVIGQRIGAADVVIVIWSERAVGSNFVKEEAQLAYDAGKLLPVKVEEVEPPVGFRRVHAANLIGWRGEAQHQQWRATLGEIRDRLGAPARQDAAAKDNKPAPRPPPWPLVGGGALIAAALALALWLQPWAPTDQAQPSETAAAEPPALETAADPPPRDVAAEDEAARRAVYEIQERNRAAREQKLREANLLPEPAAPAQTAPLTGAVWLGHAEFSNGNMQRVRFRFSADNSAQIALGELDFEAPRYRWRQEGAGVEIAAPGQETWRGTLRGGVISGDYYNAQGEQRGSFQLTRQ